MNTKTFLAVFNSIETVINNLVRTLVNILTFAVTEMAPIVAPLPPAFSIYTAMSQRLHVPFQVAIAAAFAIEVIGMFSAKVSIRCYQWNSQRTKTEPTIPRDLSITMTGVFFTVVLLLALTVELFPALVALVIPGFVLIAISVYINLAIHTNLEKLELDKANTLHLREEKNGLTAQIRTAKKEAETLAERLKTARTKLTALGRELAGQQQLKRSLENDLIQLNTQVKLGQNQPNSPANFVHSAPNDLNKANEAKQDQINRRRQELAALLDKNSQLTNRELAGQLGVSLGTIKNDKKALNGSLKIGGAG